MTIRLTFDQSSQESYKGFPDIIRAIAADHLAVFRNNWASVTRIVAPPAGTGPRTGIWVVRPDSSAGLLEFRFAWRNDRTVAHIRMVTFSEHDRVPEWVLDPDEWDDDQRPYPVITIDW
ncbi:hypothetical protein [Zavarzinella formosa]|uniref:hypothetical protein n=1 Tax=Zavarzinella formosa TaxID=360055 RepID=UPI0003031F90|nr:hypothetical protein [Zavarzinella formosa]